MRRCGFQVLQTLINTRASQQRSTQHGDCNQVTEFARQTANSYLA